ncbi:MAG: acetyl-CoA carboxylase carboxyltransferase subunit alpha [Alphaproteobacteria bacterium]|nr:acetyl-CoA carboxylase carboxyltransferase subunit alpha [Alphaproteobacteria bacterium]
MHYLDFEETIKEIDEKLAKPDINEAEQKRLNNKLNRLIERTYQRLTPWQKTQVARHEDRPHTLDYIRELMPDFFELCGDRAFGEDKSIVAGLAHFHGQTVMVIGHEKGYNTETRLKHNFGMAKPEGYRKAIRLMKLAEQFGFPVLCFVDTAGAFPGVDAEARGQGQAIASCIATQTTLKTPIITTIIGEGGSGGALALAVADKVLILENAIYSVISPEGCASILWKDFKFARQATRVLKMTAKDLLRLKVADEIIPEPKGGAHRFKKETFQAVDKAILNGLQELKNINPDLLVFNRQNKFLQIGSIQQNKKKN